MRDLPTIVVDEGRHKFFLNDKEYGSNGDSLMEMAIEICGIVENHARKMLSSFSKEDMSILDTYFLSIYLNQCLEMLQAAMRDGNTKAGQIIFNTAQTVAIGITSRYQKLRGVAVGVEKDRRTTK